MHHGNRRRRERRLPISSLVPVALVVSTGCSSGESGGIPALIEPAPAVAAAESPPGTAPPTTTAPTTTTTEPPVDLVAPPSEPILPVWQESGPDTVVAQERLLELGFWLSEASGDYGTTTTQAVMAFQKYHGLAVDGLLGPQTAEVLNTVVERPTGRSTGGTLIEVDKSLQLVFIVRDGVTEWVLNASTGSEIPYREPDQNTPGAYIASDSVTRPGVFAIDPERPDGWWAGDLGEIYRPKYFDGGIALHGAYNIPPYPASHGCVRLSTAAMDWLWDEGLAPMGTTVWVHGEIPRRNDA